MQTSRNEFAQALKAIATERGLDPSVILGTIEEAIVAAFRRDARERGEEVDTFEYEVELNPNNGEAKVFSWPMSEEDATEKVKAENKKKRKDVTPPGFGRIAAQTAKQVIHQKIREAEKGAIMEEFSGRVGSLITGMILRFDGADVIVDIGRTEAVMPASERIPNERLSLNQRLSFYLKEIVEGPKGKDVLLSRSDPDFVVKLFAREVPEFNSGSVEVKKVAREAGVRTKIAVFSSQPGVDPVGSCVGQKGVRVQAVTNELGGERVDIILWTDDVKTLVASSLSPATDVVVSINKKTETATVKVPEDQLSLAIGKDGQNVRLAAKLTGLRIEVEGTPVTAKKEEVVKEEAVVEEKTEVVSEEVEKEEEKKEEIVEPVVTEEAVVPSSEVVEEVAKEEPETVLEEAEKKEDVTETTVSDQAQEKVPEVSEEEQSS